MKTVVACALLSLLSPSLEAREKVKPSYVESGEVRDCVRTRDIRSSKVLDDKTIIFSMRGGKTYRNALKHSCPNLDFYQSFSYRTYGELCDVDVITVIRPFEHQGPSCGLGKFVQVEETKAVSDS
jgi:hypothetical protein